MGAFFISKENFQIENPHRGPGGRGRAFLRRRAATVFGAKVEGVSDQAGIGTKPCFQARKADGKIVASRIEAAR